MASAREEHALLFASRQFGEAAVGQLADARFVERLLYRRHVVRGTARERIAMGETAELDHGAHHEPRRELGPLRHVGQAARALAQIERAET